MIKWHGNEGPPSDYNGGIVLIAGHNDPNADLVFEKGESLHDWQWTWEYGRKEHHVIGYNITREDMSNPNLIRAQVWT